MTLATVRPTPCASCPFRQGVPSGVWHEDEYRKLPHYDGDMVDQSPLAFGCHQADGKLCAGWVGHKPFPDELLAVRLGVMRGSMDRSVLNYTTDVPLFESGQAACDHGLRDIETPSDRAAEVIEKIIRVSQKRRVE